MKLKSTIKTTAVVLLFAFIFFSCTKDKEIVPFELPSFENTAGTNGTDILVDIAVHNSESVMCVGYTNGTGNGGNDGWLVNFSTAGELKWQQTFGGSGDDYFNSIIKTADGGFLITGFSGSNSAGAEDVWLLKITSSGLVQWEKKYGGIVTDLGINAVQLTDGNYIVSACSQSVGAGLLDHWVFKLDINGNMLVGKTFGDNTNQGYGHIMQKPDGNFFISGGTEKNGNSDFDVIEINSNLDSLREFVFGSPLYEEAKNVVALPDGNFVLGGHSAGFGYPEHNFYCVKFDANGNIAWENNYGSLQHDGGENNLVTPEGKIIITGRSNGNPGNGEDLMYLTLDKNGKELHTTYRGSAGTDIGYKSIVVGKYIFTVGRKEANTGNTDGWIIGEPITKF